MKKRLSMSRRKESLVISSGGSHCGKLKNGRRIEEKNGENGTISDSIRT